MAEKKEFLVTQDGYDDIMKELKDLKLNQRPKITQALKDARAQGDLSENADYDAACNDKAQLEDRIKELEFVINNAKIIKESGSNCVMVGKTVTIAYEDDLDDTEEYKIVGSLEADPFNNKISNESPLGTCLMGKKVGDIIDVESPNGTYTVKITSIA